MTVAVIDYGSGNLRSVAKALERAAAENAGSRRVIVTGDAHDVLTAERIVLPGVGAFADCKAGLDALPGMTGALSRAVVENGTPFLGICVGMQLLATVGREHGDHRGLGWIDGAVEAIDPGPAGLAVPHMGWNNLVALDDAHPLFAGIAEGTHMYFVHSYRFIAANRNAVRAEVQYGGPIAAAIGRDNIFGTQFHPEKSQAGGLALLANFLGWRP